MKRCSCSFPAASSAVVLLIAVETVSPSLSRVRLCSAVSWASAARLSHPLLVGQELRKLRLQPFELGR